MGNFQFVSVALNAVLCTISLVVHPYVSLREEVPGFLMCLSTMSVRNKLCTQKFASTHLFDGSWMVMNGKGGLFMIIF